MPAISVLLPVNRAGAALVASVRSLLAQTWHDLEIIAVVDGAPAAEESLGRLAEQDRERLRVFAGPGRGLVAALELARRRASSPLIARHDGDDLAHPDRLRLQRELLLEGGHALVGSRVCFFPSPHVGAGLRHYQDWLNQCITPAEIAREMFVENPIAHPTFLAEASALERVGGYREQGWVEDYDLVLRLHAAGASFAKVPRTLVAMREHAGRTTWLDPRCSQEAFFRCKAHFLVRGPIAGRAFAIWGAGRAGGMLARALALEGAVPRFFIDIDPRKIGGSKRALPVHAPPVLDAPGRPFILVAVGTRGARAILRARLAGEMRLREGVDFLLAA
jgi:glycosyltransferase involved in cell wall biosynthesis